MNLSDLRDRATVSVPEAGQLLGIGRDAAYAAAERGEIPVLKLGRHLRVPVPRLLELIGVPADRPEHSEAGASTAPATATVHALAHEKPGGLQHARRHPA